MRDLFSEIYENLRRNKLRTALTGFAVAWGIFMLIVLLGAGQGLVNSFSKSSGEFASNTIMSGPGRSTIPYNGMKAGRRMRMTEDDVALTGGERFASNVDDVIAYLYLQDTVRYGKEVYPSWLSGDFPRRKDLDKIVIRHGRYVNDLDISENRKVVVIPEDMAEVFSDGSSSADMLGKYVKIGAFSYQVVGIMKKDAMSNSSEVTLPFSTMKTIYGKGKDLDMLLFSFHGLNSMEENEAFENRYLTSLNLLHGASPIDRGTFWTWNRFTQNLQMQKASSILYIALWIIGLFTLLSGIVGVSNIMLISVKERTHEFGIRKAIGARPWAIIRLIISESLVITTIFGYIGMVFGMLACEMLDKTIGQSTTSVMGTEFNMLINPTVGLDVALEATLVLIIAGTIAGFFPARKAARVKPVEALRSE